MLKFSGFANLTSCLSSKAAVRMQFSTTNQHEFSRLAETAKPDALKVSRVPRHFLKLKNSQPAREQSSPRADWNAKHRH